MRKTPKAGRIQSSRRIRRRARQDEPQPHDDCTQDAPEKNRILVRPRDLKEAKDDGEDKDVVHRQRPFDQISSEKQDPGLAAAPPPGQGVERGGQQAPEQSENGRFGERRRTVSAMEYPQVQRQEQDHQAHKGEPVPKVDFRQGRFSEFGD